MLPVHTERLMKYNMFVRINVQSYKTICYGIPLFYLVVKFITDFGFVWGFFPFSWYCEGICLVKLQITYLTDLGFFVVLPSALHFSENVPQVVSFVHVTKLFL